MAMSGSLIDVDEIIEVLHNLGLHDPGVLDAMRFKDTDDLVAALFQGRTVLLTTAARDYVDDQLLGSSPRASLARRL